MVVLYILGIVLYAQNVLANCYAPDGTDRNGLPGGGSNKYTPCETDNGDHSMCCNTGVGDTCHDDGLCWNEAKLLWRESCTDPTWQSPKCLKLCVDDGTFDGQARNHTDVVVTECGDGSFCCGEDDDARKCCEGGLGVRIENGLVVSSGSSSTIAPTTSSTTNPGISSSSEALTDTTPSPPSPDKRNDKAIIGGAVGGGLGVLLLLAGGAAYLIRRRKGANDTIIKSQDDLSHDVPVWEKPSELPPGARPVELEGEYPLPPGNHP